MLGRLLLRQSELPTTHIADNELDYSDNVYDNDTATKYYY
jgi:hypothetical protein